jgi:hypothetical protein
LDQAIENHSEAIRLNPEDAEAYFDRATCDDYNLSTRNTGLTLNRKRLLARASNPRLSSHQRTRLLYQKCPRSGVRHRAYLE